MSAIKNNFWQFILFGAIGAIGTAGHYITLIFLVEILHWEPTTSTLIGAIVGALINYILNYKYTFKSNKSHQEAVTKFMIIAAIGAGINTVLMFLFVHLLEIYYLLAQIITTGIVLVWNFLLNKIWTFSYGNQQDNNDKKY